MNSFTKGKYPVKDCMVKVSSQMFMALNLTDITADIVGVLAHICCL